MIFGKTGQIVKEDFTVVDGDKNLITGLIDANFSKDIFNSDGNEVSGTIDVIVSELGNGHYRAAFIPNAVGMWFLSVYHTTYFPWGKTDTIQIFNNDFDTFVDILTRILGLTQENHYLDNTSYDDNNNLISCRIRLYDDSTKVGTDDNVIVTYHITAGYTDRLLDYYKVVKQ